MAKQSFLSTIKFAVLFNLIFLVLLAIPALILGHNSLIMRFLMAYGILWVCLVSFMILLLALRSFKFNDVNNFGAYLFFNSVTVVFLLLAWSLFASYQIHQTIGNSGFGVKALMHVLGFLSSYTAYALVSTFYQGDIYKKYGLVVAVVSYVVFSIWPQFTDSLVHALI